jgi:hypothetical protein
MNTAGGVFRWDLEPLQIVNDFQCGNCSIRTVREEIRYVQFAMSPVPGFIVSALLLSEGLTEFAHDEVFRQLEADGLLTSSELGDVPSSKTWKLPDGRLLRVAWQSRERECEAQVALAAGEDAEFVDVPFFWPLIFPADRGFARCKTYTLTRAGLAVLDAASRSRVAETSTPGPETRPGQNNVQSATSPTQSGRVALPEPPSKCREAFELSRCKGMSQAEIAEEMNKRHGSMHGQGHISKLIARYEQYLKLIGVLDRMPPSAKRAKAFDPSILEIGARRDGRTPRQRDGGIEDRH